MRPAHEVLVLTRIGLLVALVLHVVAAVQLTVLDRQARPVGYVKKSPQAATLASRTLRWGGVLILVFVVYHLMHLTWGTVHPDFIEGDPYHNLVAGFQRPGVVVFYLVALMAVGLHLYHGAWASLPLAGRRASGPQSAAPPGGAGGGARSVDRPFGDSARGVVRVARVMSTVKGSMVNGHQPSG